MNKAIPAIAFATILTSQSTWASGTNDWLIYKPADEKFCQAAMKYPKIYENLACDNAGTGRPAFNIPGKETPTQSSLSIDILVRPKLETWSAQHYSKTLYFFSQGFDARVKSQYLFTGENGDYDVVADNFIFNEKSLKIVGKPATSLTKTGETKTLIGKVTYSQPKLNKVTCVSAIVGNDVNSMQTFECFPIGLPGNAEEISTFINFIKTIRLPSTPYYDGKAK